MLPQPFIFNGVVSLTGEPEDDRSVRILRDTGCSQSVILADRLPFSELSYCGYSIVLSGIEMGYVPHPVHCVHIQSKFVTGIFPVAVCHALPIKGIKLLMGNDIAGGKVISALEVLDLPPCTEIAKPSSVLFASCVVTRTQAHKINTDINTVSLSLIVS